MSLDPGAMVTVLIVEVAKIIQFWVSILEMAWGVPEPGGIVTFHSRPAFQLRMDFWPFNPGRHWNAPEPSGHGGGIALLEFHSASQLRCPFITYTSIDPSCAKTGVPADPLTMLSIQLPVLASYISYRVVAPLVQIPQRYGIAPCWFMDS